jgi:hypothetical protein
MVSSNGKYLYLKGDSRLSHWDIKAQEHKSLFRGDRRGRLNFFSFLGKNDNHFYVFENYELRKMHRGYKSWLGYLRLNRCFLTSQKIRKINITLNEDEVYYIDDHQRIYIANAKTGITTAMFLNNTRVECFTQDDKVNCSSKTSANEVEKIWVLPAKNQFLCLYNTGIRLYEVGKQNIEANIYRYSLEQLWAVGVQLEKEDLRAIGKSENRGSLLE